MRKSKSARPSCTCRFDSIIVFLLSRVVVGRNAFVASSLCVSHRLYYSRRMALLKGPFFAKLKEPLTERSCPEENLLPTSVCPLPLIVLNRHHCISNCVGNCDAPFSMVASQE